MAVPIPSVCPACRPTPGARCRSTQRPRGSAVRAGLAAPIRSRQMGRRRRRRKWPRRRRLGHRSGRVAGPSTPAARRAGWRCRAGQPPPSARRPGRRPASLGCGADSGGKDEAVTAPGDSGGLHARDLGQGSRKLSPSAGCRNELRDASRRRWSWADGRRSAGIRRAPSRTISSSAARISARPSSSVTTLNIGVPSITGAPTPVELVLVQRGRYVAPPNESPIHRSGHTSVVIATATSWPGLQRTRCLHCLAAQPPQRVLEYRGPGHRRPSFGVRCGGWRADRWPRCKGTSWQL